MATAHKSPQQLTNQKLPSKPLTLKQLKSYPESARNPTFPAPLKQGKVQVGRSRGKEFSLYYKRYGHGPRRIVWLVGHGDRIRSLRRFVSHFGHENQQKYTSLFLENRGVGESEGPLGWWSTNDLAMDVKELMDGLGWNEPRSVNVVGHSMGGMIAQELALICAERIASLTLISTTSNWLADLSLWSGAKNVLSQIIPKSEDAKLTDIKSTFFGRSWPNEPDEEGIFPTNGDNWAGSSYLNEQIPYRAAILQTPACVGHKLSAEQLQRLSEQIDRSRIQILHGREDKLIPWTAAERLFEQLGGLVANGPKLHIFEDTSHLPTIERFAQTRDLIETMIEAVNT